MRLVLECHSCITCIDEPMSYRVIARIGKTGGCGSLVGLKTPCVTEQLDSSSLYDPFFLTKIPNTYERQPLVFLVRDVRDTVVSMLALRLHGRRWYDVCLMPTLAAKRLHDERFVHDYGGALASADEARHPTLARAALYWRYKVESLDRYIRCGFPALMVRYEDLVASPREELSNVCALLKVPYEEGLLDHPRMDHAAVDGDGFAIGGTDVRRPIDTASAGRWRGKLGDEELDIVLRFAGPVQAALYS